MSLTWSEGWGRKSKEGHNSNRRKGRRGSEEKKNDAIKGKSARKARSAFVHYSCRGGEGESIYIGKEGE